MKLPYFPSEGQREQESWLRTLPATFPGLGETIKPTGVLEQHYHSPAALSKLWSHFRKESEPRRT